MKWNVFMLCFSLFFLGWDLASQDWAFAIVMGLCSAYWVGMIAVDRRTR